MILLVNNPPEAENFEIISIYFQLEMLCGNSESHLQYKKNLVPTGTRSDIRNIINVIFDVFNASTIKKNIKKNQKNLQNFGRLRP